MTSARYVATIVERDFQLALSTRVPFLFDVLGILAALTIYYFVGRFVGRPVGGSDLGFLGFVAAGLAAMQLQAALLRAIQGLDREQASGGLELLMIGPVRPAVVALAACAFPLARGAVGAVGVLIATRVLFDVQLTLEPGAWWGIALGLAGAAASFAGLALLCFSVLVALRQGPAAANVVGLLVPVLSGVFFPPSLLPDTIEDVATWSPLTIAIGQVRRAVTGGEVELDRLLAMAAGLTLLGVVAAAVCDVVVRRAKRLGTLGHS